MTDEFQGKSFSITDPQGVNTVIYRINKTAKELQKQYPKYTVERLVYSEEMNGNMKKKTFYVDYPEPEGEDLVILSFGQDKVVVNMGLLKDNKLKISKRPIPVKFDTVYSETPFEMKDFNYTPNLQRAFTIIDPETTEEVKPKLYIDSQTNELVPEARLLDIKDMIANPYEKLVNLLIEGPKNEKNKKLMPENTQLLQNYLEGDCIVLDFSAEFLNYDKEAENGKENLINSIVNTLTELTEINEVKILINGQENPEFNEVYTRT